MSYLYLKKASKVSRISRIPLSKTHKKILAFSMFTMGLFLIGYVTIPILRSQVAKNNYRQVVSPVSTKFYNQTSILGEVTTDYTNLDNWFNGPKPVVQNDTLETPLVDFYTLSIPKLKIENAVVSVKNQDLKKNLVQYPNTALPGQLGSPVIFGHSVLPQFFNPKSYMTIFSTLYKLKSGDEILINFDNVTYKYLVQESYEVKPNDLSVLEQQFDTKSLTIITCHPPGTYLRRLVIKAQLYNL